MKPRIGFSTGAVAFGDYRSGLRILRERRIGLLELSSLRDRELEPLVNELNSLPLTGFSFISFHAPSSLSTMTESALVGLLRKVLVRQWPIIVHPDVISNVGLWQGFGEWLCIENMDKRKPIGRTVAELEPVFATFPDASFCFDIGHARQIDPTMSEAALLLRRYGSRLKEIHMSEVTSSSRHGSISFTALSAFRKVAHLIPQETPIILESVVSEGLIEQEIEAANSVFNVQKQFLAKAHALDLVS